MLENNAFNREWSKIQQSLWDIASSAVDANSVAAKGYNKQSGEEANVEQTNHFNHWLTEVDSFWGDHAKVASDDIDSLYKKVSSCSHFFFNFSEALTPATNAEMSGEMLSKYFEAFATKGKSLNEEETDSPSDDDKSNVESVDLAPFWKTLNSFQNSVPELFTSPTENQDFKNALEEYLVSLQKYQMLFMQLFMTSAKQAIELLDASEKQEISTKQMMSLWLDILETNYESLILGSDYSKHYAQVVNSWVLMVSKSGKDFSKFMQSVSKAPWTNANG